MRALRFRAVLEQSGRTATGMEVPAEVVSTLGAGKRPAVRVTINGHTYRSSVASMGGRFMLGVSAENRTAAGVSAGDVLDVEVALDTEPREVTVPADLATALAADPVARAAFEALSYSAKQRYVLPIEQAKAPETRARRVAKTVESLRSGG
jgi:hypothetical protein